MKMLREMMRATVKAVEATVQKAIEPLQLGYLRFKEVNGVKLHLENVTDRHHFNL